MVFPLAGIIGGMIGTRALHAGSVAGASFLKSPIIQGGGFGVGYTGGAYLGYGGTNTADPLGLHKPKYRYTQTNLGLPTVAIPRVSRITVTPSASSAISIVSVRQS